MNFSRFYSDRFDRVYVARDALTFPAVERCRETLPDALFSVVTDQRDIPREALKSTTLFLSLPRGEVFGKCPGTHGHLCCNYNTLDLYLGCTLSCSYCIMRSYLNFAPVTVYVDPAPGIEAVLRTAERNPRKRIRVGTGEVGDSLLLDPLFRLSEDFITAFADADNVVFEMKTKTTFVDHLLEHPAKGNAVIGFSLSPESAARAEDGSSSPIAERLAAADRASRAGYGLAFHFDPIIRSSSWREETADLARRLERFRERRVEWISMGTIRFPAGHRDFLADRSYFFDEFVPCRDGKFRYLQKERIALYRHLRDLIAEVSSAPLYLCMESTAVWQAVFGRGPLDEGARGEGTANDGVPELFAPIAGIAAHRRSGGRQPARPGR